ncbi:MAG TPA: hypothetical protein VIV12_06235, partial [Streptosporangiaceae bacterium]
MFMLERATAWRRWLGAQHGILLAPKLALMGLWATTQGALLQDRPRTVVAAWLNAATLSAAAAVMAVLVAVLAWLLPRPSKLLRKPPARRAKQARERLVMVMVRRVRHNWITGVLEPSLAQAAHLALGLKRRPDTLDLGTRARRSPGRPPQPLDVGTPISEVLDQAGGGLLILGVPGAGKTTLLQLAAALLDRAEGNPDQPIPVVVNLASWARRRQP